MPMPAMMSVPPSHQALSESIVKARPTATIARRRAIDHGPIGMWPSVRPPARLPTEKTASTMPASSPPWPNVATTPASTAAHAPMRRNPTTVASSTAGLVSTLPMLRRLRGMRTRPDLGGEDEPQPAADEDDDDQQERLDRAHLRRDEGGEHRRDDPDDLLQAGVEREQRGQLPRVDQLRVDRARGGLDGRSGEPREHAERHVAGQRQLDQGDQGEGHRADQHRGREHRPHAPSAHPAARDRAGDGLTDGCRGEHQPGGSVRPGDLLDVQQDGEARHAGGEPRRQLGRDDAPDARRLQQIPVPRVATCHPSTLSPAPRAATRRRCPRHARTVCPQADRMSEARHTVEPVDGCGRGIRFRRVSGVFQTSNPGCSLWMKRWTTCVVSEESGGKLHGCNY